MYSRNIIYPCLPALPLGPWGAAMDSDLAALGRCPSDPSLHETKSLSSKFCGICLSSLPCSLLTVASKTALVMFLTRSASGRDADMHIGQIHPRSVAHNLFALEAAS